jgi:hypothetical protein
MNSNNLKLIVSNLNAIKKQIKQIEDELLDSVIEQNFNDDLDELDYDNEKSMVDKETEAILEKRLYEEDDEEIKQMIREIEEDEKQYFPTEIDEVFDINNSSNIEETKTQLITIKNKQSILNKKLKETISLIEIEKDKIKILNRKVASTESLLKEKEHLLFETLKALEDNKIQIVDKLKEELLPQINMNLVSTSSNDFLKITKINKTSITYDLYRIDENGSKTLIKSNNRKKMKFDDCNKIYIQPIRDKETYYLTNKPIEYKQL